MAVCVRQVDELFRSLTALPELKGRSATPPSLAALRAIAERSDIEEVLRNGLHDFLDGIQRQLIAFTNALGSTFFAQRH